MGLFPIILGVILALVVIISIGIAITRMNDDSTPRTTPKDFFLYLATAVTLYISAGSLIALLFEIVNSLFQDPLAPVYYGGFASGGIRWAVASLIIIFPLYLFLSWFIRKNIVANSEKARIAIRRWFIFFTLFVAGGTIVGDLVALINTFLGGEITTRFILKVLVLLVIAGAIFWYYFYDLRRVDRGDIRMRTSLVWIAALAVLASIIGGFVVMGSPASQRAFRFDEMRIGHLQEIQWQIINYWQTKSALPETLAELTDDIRGFRVPTDPRSSAAYTYEVEGPQTFSLCATFEREMLEDGGRYPKEYYGPFSEADNWTHPAGEHCFERTIDPDQYPPYEPTMMRP